MIKYLIKLNVLLVLAIIISDCSSGGKCSNCNSNSPTNLSANAITIDNAGVIPIFNQSTTTTIISPY